MKLMQICWNAAQWDRNVVFLVGFDDCVQHCSGNVAGTAGADTRSLPAHAQMCTSKGNVWGQTYIEDPWGRVGLIISCFEGNQPYP